MVKVSIVVPVYNVEKYVEKCLDTLVKQTLKDIEIIIVNDGAIDKSKEKIESFLDNEEIKKILVKNNINIIYLEKENGGLSDARNFGMPYATGKYIAFIDSDDYIEYDMYEKMYELAEKENSDLVECDFYWEYINEKTGEVKTKEDKRTNYINKHEMLENIRVVAWNKLIRRDIVEKTKVIFPKGLRYEDVEFTYKLLPSLNKISYLEKTCVHYIQRENSISNSQNERTKEIFEVLENVINYYKEKGIYEEYKMQLEYIYVRYAFCSSFLRMVKIKDSITRKKCLELTMKNVKSKFPNWKKNKILKKTKTFKNMYIRSINNFTYKIYSKIFR